MVGVAGGDSRRFVSLLANAAAVCRRAGLGGSPGDRLLSGTPATGQTPQEAQPQRLAVVHSCHTHHSGAGGARDHSRAQRILRGNEQPASAYRLSA